MSACGCLRQACGDRVELRGVPAAQTYLHSKEGLFRKIGTNEYEHIEGGMFIYLYDGSWQIYKEKRNEASGYCRALVDADCPTAVGSAWQLYYDGAWHENTGMIVDIVPQAGTDCSACALLVSI